ncbi:hypothetical protein B0H14DRAFT_2375147 [Mycena olivaceomarginata]|nr:hypothetical protein B0H14DRAFT_2375147 [Mycena olivaceomarginata]
MGREEKTRKHRPAPTEPYKTGVRPPKPGKDAPKTSAKPVADGKRRNLTTFDWLNVFAFIDDHLAMSQEDVTKHFRTLATGLLIFVQETLSRNLKRRAELEARAKSNPSGLSSKRERVVTRPDVERGLVMWVAQIEGKNETVTGDMLIEKRRRLEDAFGVPEEEQLRNGGWLQSFLKMYVHPMNT